MKRYFPLVVLLALMDCQEAKTQTVVATTGAKQQLTIASWNLEWLDTTPKKAYQRRSDADYKKLQDYAKLLDADIIAFQEVADEDSIAKVFDQNTYDIILSSRKNDQRTGFAIRKGIHYQKNSENKALSLGGTVRNGIDITLTNGRNKLRLLNVHLKSYCFTNQDETRADRAKDCKKYKKQIDILDNWIEEREAENIAYAVLGDFNRRLKRSDDKQARVLLKEDGKKVMTLLGHDDASKCLTQNKHNKKGKPYRNREFIDHIAFSNKAMAYYQADSFSHHAYQIEDVQTYKISDHCPVAVDIML